MCSAPGRCTCAGETKIPASTQTLDPIFVIVVFDCNNICRCPVCKFVFKMSDTRVKNTATAPQIAKCLRANVTCLDPKKYMASTDKVAEAYRVLSGFASLDTAANYGCPFAGLRGGVS